MGYTMEAYSIDIINKNGTSENYKNCEIEFANHVMIIEIENELHVIYYNDIKSYTVNLEEEKQTEQTNDMIAETFGEFKNIIKRIYSKADEGEVIHTRIILRVNDYISLSLTYLDYNRSKDTIIFNAPLHDYQDLCQCCYITGILESPNYHDHKKLKIICTNTDEYDMNQCRLIFEGVSYDNTYSVIQDFNENTDIYNMECLVFRAEIIRSEK